MVQAIFDYVHDHIAFDYACRPTKTAFDVHASGAACVATSLISRSRCAVA